MKLQILELLIAGGIQYEWSFRTCTSLPEVVCVREQLIASRILPCPPLPAIRDRDLLTESCFV
jgi:hypothetical protein